MKHLLFLLALPHFAAMANLPHYANPNMPGSQAWHNQQALGAYMTDEWNKRRAAEAAAAALPKPEPFTGAKPVVTGLANRYGAIVVEYRNISPDEGAAPLTIHSSGQRHRADYATPQEAEAAARELCNSPNCETAAVYANSCNAVAAGWLKDRSGSRIYTASRPHFLSTYHLGFDNERITATVEAAMQDALQRCQHDPAVDPATCISDDFRAQYNRCALPHIHSGHQACGYGTNNPC